MKNILRAIFFSFLILSLTTGCASFGKSMKEFLGGNTKKTRIKKTSKKVVGKVNHKKNYQRTDHKTLQEKSLLGADSGSLWIERGQGSYLFTQNTNRLIGDLVNVEIDGQAKKQIETKVGVIQNLIDRIKKQQEERKLAALKRKSGTTKGGKKAEAAPAPAAAPAKKKQKFEVKIVPSRITDILKDGSYMVQGINLL